VDDEEANVGDRGDKKTDDGDSASQVTWHGYSLSNASI
jgi:hypothetical protein